MGNFPHKNSNNLRIKGLFDKPLNTLPSTSLATKAVATPL